MAKDELKVEEPKVKGRKPKTEEPKVSGDSTEEMVKQTMMLQAQNNELKARLKDAYEKLNIYAQNDFYQRLEWLWRIITLAGSADEFGGDFYNKIVNEFKAMMFPPEEPAQKKQ